jgi:homoserine trans-succinylase
MFLAVSNVTKYVRTSADVEAYMVTSLTARNMNMFKFSDAQYEKIVYNYNSTKEKLYKTKAPIWYYKKRAKSINLCSCWNINGDHQNVLNYFGGKVQVL